jgi:Fe-S cluster assembly protein SufD
MSALPTRRAEAWRYSNLAALNRVWPLPAPEQIIVPAHGAFHRVIVQDRGAVHQLVLSVGKQATAEIQVLNIGGDYGRIEITVTLHEGAAFHLDAVQLGSEEQTLEIVTTVHHSEPHATSRQTVRSVLGGQATGTYLGKIHVWPAAQKTDAQQSAKALLLARTATANIKPELEIHADDVTCAHGATVGELDKQALFYMATRGIDPAEAKALLTEAFLLDVLEAVPDATQKAELESLIATKLRAMTGAAT